MAVLARDVTHHETPRSRETLVALRRIIRSIDLHSRAILRRSGVTGPQLVVLSRLARLGENSVSELAAAVSLAQGTVTGILDRLVGRGLAARRRDERDKRRVLVRVTPAADVLLADAPPLLQEHFLERFAGLAEWEQNQILSSLQRVVAMMEASSMDAAPILASGPLGDHASLNGPHHPPGETTDHPAGSEES